MKSKTSAVLMIVLTFMLGAVAGAVGLYLYSIKVAASTPKAAPRSTPHDVAEELGKGLNLNPDQKAQLKVIINQSRERFRALSQQFSPQSEAIRSETRQAIRQILNEEQKARFEKIVQDIDKRHREHNHRNPQ